MTALVPAGLFGAGTGAALGLVGGGGSILAVPALVYGLGMPVAQAVPTALLVVAGTATARVVPRLRRGEVRWRVAGVFGAAGIGAAFGGAAVNRLLPERILLGVFAALMLVVGATLLRGRPERRAPARFPAGGSTGGPACPKPSPSAPGWDF